ncbi:uncharacterized protein LOC125202277 isoform X4 [Salvia hispanica]|uniref:uncharacterized protein LOC125202277 isoform X4 n=1 Tax=Salvia hispanica TaxID=49212 RepID=UPI002009B325|nr:uncharacterized protein LOC125202277 isoform X4 [Salvia hispanica]
MHRVIKFGLVLTLIILTSASIGAAGARGGGTRGLGFGDEDKISRQREELLSLVETVLEENGGTPYTHQLFQHMKVELMKLPKGNLLRMRSMLVVWLRWRVFRVWRRRTCRGRRRVFRVWISCGLRRWLLAWRQIWQKQSMG